MRLIQLVTVCALAAIVAACGTNPPGSVQGGDCKAFKRIAVETCGLTEEDQGRIDEKVEEGVAACHWKRPDNRTPSCEQLRDEIAQLRAERPIVKAPEKKSIWKTIKKKIPL